MPAFNFRPKFAFLIKSGVKTSTIRLDRKDGRPHAKVGDNLSLFIKMRQKGCERLLDSTCIDVRRVRITEKGVQVVNQGKWHDDWLSDEGLKELVQQEGFKSFDELKEFFLYPKGEEPKQSVEGTQIRWAHV